MKKEMKHQAVNSRKERSQFTTRKAMPGESCQRLTLFLLHGGTRQRKATITTDKAKISHLPSTTWPSSKNKPQQPPVVAYNQRANPGPEYSSNKTAPLPRRAVSDWFELLFSNRCWRVVEVESLEKAAQVGEPAPPSLANQADRSAAVFQLKRIAAR